MNFGINDLAKMLSGIPSKQRDPRYPNNSYNGGGEYQQMTPEEVSAEDAAWVRMTPEQQQEYMSQPFKQRAQMLPQYMNQNPDPTYSPNIQQEQNYPQQSQMVNMANDIQNRVAPSGSTDSNIQTISEFQQNIPSKVQQPSGYNTKASVVDYMKSQGNNSSFANRKALAAQLGIDNYTGTMEQNMQLLKMLQNPNNQANNTVHAPSYSAYTGM
jgi:hypothetical protein